MPRDLIETIAAAGALTGMPMRDRPIARPVPAWAGHAAWLVERGWCQMNYDTPNGEVCLVGALLRVTCTNPKETGNHPRRLKPFLRALGFSSQREAERWNDTTGRTKEEVAARLRAAQDIPEMA